MPTVGLVSSRVKEPISFSMSSVESLGPLRHVAVQQTPYSASNKEEEHSLKRSRQRQPLQKYIRKRSWSSVMTEILRDPSQIYLQNGVGWSSLILAIYHSAPCKVISKMLTLLSEDRRRYLLSTPVPTGSRLCLHFAARYSNSLEVIQLLTEPYPEALLAKSSDGVTPHERAVYYRKDTPILLWLEKETRKQKDLQNLQKYNQNLRNMVTLCCKSRWKDVKDGGIDTISSTTYGGIVVHLYVFTMEREMISLFWNILSYVGVQSIPSSFGEYTHLLEM